MLQGILRLYSRSHEMESILSESKFLNGEIIRFNSRLSSQHRALRLSNLPFRKRSLPFRRVFAIAMFLGSLSVPAHLDFIMSHKQETTPNVSPVFFS